MDSDVLKLYKLIQICQSIDRGYDIRIEQTRKNHYPVNDILEARLAWKRKLLAAIIDVLQMKDVLIE